MNIIDKVLKYIKQHGLFQKCERVVVAVSGGPDSVALLKCMAHIATHYDLHLIVAHLNHGMRGEESMEEERFVRDLSKKMDIAFESGFSDIPLLKEQIKGSWEELARCERYRFLFGVARRSLATKIAVGHHADDQAETVLMNFLRGAGAEGLIGMRPIRDGIIVRPLLDVHRHEILEYLDKEQLDYKTDSSNMSVKHLRNRIRQKLMPELKAEYNSRLEDNLGRLSEIMRIEDDYLATVVQNFLSGWGLDSQKRGSEIPLAEFFPLHEALQKRIIKKLLERLAPENKGIGHSHIQTVLSFLKSGGPQGVLHMPHRIRMRRVYDRLRIDMDRDIEYHGEFAYGVTIPANIDIKEAGVTLQTCFVEAPSFETKKNTTEYLDYDTIAFPLYVRNIRPGDRIQPLGMKGSQKLKKFFIDHKISTEVRKRIPLLVDQASVIWIPGMRLSERVKINKKTKRTVKIEII